MKKLIILFVFTALSLSLLANEADRLTDSAQNCFMQSKYAEALALYDSVCQMGYSSSNLFYNIGNCYYRLNDVANSVYYFEKALLLNPSNKDAEFNLKIVNQQLKQVVEPLPIPFYDKWTNNLLNIMSSDAWTIFNIVLFVIMLAGVAIFLFMNKVSMQKIGFSVAIVSLVLFVVSAICAYKSSRLIIDNNYAVIFDQSMVKSSPNADAINLFEICEGLKVQVVDSANNMYNIKLMDGKEGWINSADLKLLSE